MATGVLLELDTRHPDDGHTTHTRRGDSQDFDNAAFGAFLLWSWYSFLHVRIS